jgi:glycerol-3-phosphate dehydrogenase (NAD(P)+)
MGLVCAGILAGRLQGHGSVRMWGHDPAEVRSIAASRASSRLGGFRLSDAVSLGIDPARQLTDAEVIVSAVPVQFVRETWQSLRPFIAPGASVISVAKGIEVGTNLTPLQVISQVLGESADAARPMGVLSGPTIASELARCLPATMVAASDQTAMAEQIQSLFSTRWLRVYTSSDVRGVEIAGAAKNVIAIAAGILDGLQAGCNAKSALLARGLAEITRLGAAMGASPATFAGIAGAGDLATTCFSPEGRNRSCGEALGKGEKLDAYLARTRYVVEGVATTKGILQLAHRCRVEMPISKAVHAVLFESLDPVDALTNLMSREVKGE